MRAYKNEAVTGELYKSDVDPSGEIFSNFQRSFMIDIFIFSHFYFIYLESSDVLCKILFHFHISFLLFKHLFDTTYSALKIS